MKKQTFRVDSDGFNGAWYPAPVKNGRAIAFMKAQGCAKLGVRCVKE